MREEHKLDAEIFIINFNYRSEIHTHNNHDNKILKKFKAKKVFSTLLQAEESVTEKRPKVKKGRRKVSSSATTRGSIGSTFNII